jgi:hypothetical protein
METLKDIFTFLASFVFAGAALILLVGTLWFVIVNQKTKKLRKNLKEGDTVRFYVGEEKYRGTVVNKSELYVKIQCFLLDNIQTRFINEIYLP